MPTLTDASGFRHKFDNDDEETIARMLAGACLRLRKEEFSVANLGGGLFELQAVNCRARWVVEPATMSPAFILAQGKPFAARLNYSRGING